MRTVYRDSGISKGMRNRMGSLSNCSQLSEMPRNLILQGQQFLNFCIFSSRSHPRTKLIQNLKLQNRSGGHPLQESLSLPLAAPSSTQDSCPRPLCGAQSKTQGLRGLAALGFRSGELLIKTPGGCGWSLRPGQLRFPPGPGPHPH